MDFLAFIVAAVISGVVSGITNGISIRVSDTIAGKSKPRKRKKPFIVKAFWFIVLTVAIYLVIKYWSVLLAFL
jgi:Mn2+/Fe2+ NRAMP family transporter